MPEPKDKLAPAKPVPTKPVVAKSVSAAPASVTPAVNLTGRRKALFTDDPQAAVSTVTLLSGETFRIALDDVPQALHRRLAFHGLRQKVHDAKAGRTGAAAAARMKAVYDQLIRGVWIERTPKVDPAVRRREVAAAIMVIAGPDYQRMYGKPITMEVVLAYSRKQFNQLARHPRVLVELGRQAPAPRAIGDLL